MEEIKQYFEQLVGISASDWDVFSSQLKKVEYPKKAKLLKVGQTEQHLSFIEKGSARLFFPGEENDVTFWFCFQNEFVSAYDSFIQQLPSSYQIETMSPAILWQITYEGLQTVYKTTEIGNTIGRLVAENLYLMKAGREHSLLRETAEERYLALFKKYPHFLQEIPLKHLASYIGVTPQALSRIRKRIS
ncbi:MAG TPA: CarD family transcriptional regulator [Cytophagales bacterium]|nr:CarD family transcriptional regulator [Cytophagales bacterium]HAA18063.1 CarD family transcriptional regulator [Cytophagales bacterium]HAP62387.1 CarD family transcriptional regulator [Cytophagales bacterium]